MGIPRSTKERNKEMSFTTGMRSSNTDEWATPQYLFDELNEEFRFDVDVCANEENHKCPVYFNKEQDGLSFDWGGYKSVWCNPPYGRQIRKWVKKAYESGTQVVMLLPARTDTTWFHEWIYGKAEIRFIRGRVKFGNGKVDAPFPSMVVIFRKE